MRCASVADAQPALQQGSRSLAELEDQPHSVVEELIIVAFRRSIAFELLALFAWRLQEALHVLGLALRLPEFDHRRGLMLADIGSMQAHQPRSPRRTEEHVATPQQRL